MTVVALRKTQSESVAIPTQGEVLRRVREMNPDDERFFTQLMLDVGHAVIRSNFGQIELAEEFFNAMLQAPAQSIVKAATFWLRAMGLRGHLKPDAQSRAFPGSLTQEEYEELMWTII